MKKYSLDRFINEEKRLSNRRIQLRITTRRYSTRQRNPEETRLLIKATLERFRKAEETGLLKRDNRKWYFNFQ